MAPGVHSQQSLSKQVRQTYLAALLRDLPAALQAIGAHTRNLLQHTADPVLFIKRRDALTDLNQKVPLWYELLRKLLQENSTIALPLAELATANLQRPQPKAASPNLSLVDDATIEHDILESRLAQTIWERTRWQFSDLHVRLSTLENGRFSSTADFLAPQTLAKLALKSWLSASLTTDIWRTLHQLLHDEIALLAEAGYHEANRWLLSHGVCPEIDLRPFIRLARSASRSQQGTASAAPNKDGAAQLDRPFVASSQAVSFAPTAPAIDDLVPLKRESKAVLKQLSQFMSQQLQPLEAALSAPQGPQGPVAPSTHLKEAIHQVQSGLMQQYSAPPSIAEPKAAPSIPTLTQELLRQKAVLKQAAETPIERAIIEVVALMFQSILVDEHVLATVRVWFARLQMPVLRVAIDDKNFFANIEHPARLLIDRMGSCVMGFDNQNIPIGEVLENEIKRIVQVIEAYPDTGTRVFQTVLTEFESFLQNYFQHQNEASRKGVSLAQQVEQRETLAVQYTIELRKMLNEVAVQEGVRDFLFHIWADVLAITAIKSGTQGEAIKQMKRVAADLIWSASAKVSREERADVIRRLPSLLKTIREGMGQVGLPVSRQDELIQMLNSSLAAAFTAKAPSISSTRLSHLMEHLETLDELLPGTQAFELDPATIMDLSGYETDDLEVVGEGGAAPTPAMLNWASQLQVGSWYQLDYRNRLEPVQLAWQGLRKHLTLFVTPQGRGILFQQHRLASFLQAGLLAPAEDESLTTRATRKALAKLDADPQRLIN